MSKLLDRNAMKLLAFSQDYDVRGINYKGDMLLSQTDYIMTDKGLLPDVSHFTMSKYGVIRQGWKVGENDLVINLAPNQAVCPECLEPHEEMAYKTYCEKCEQWHIESEAYL